MRKRGRDEEAAEVTAVEAEETRTALSAKPPQARLSIAERKRLKKAKPGQPSPKPWRAKPLRCGAAPETRCIRIRACVSNILGALHSLHLPRGTRGRPPADGGALGDVWGSGRSREMGTAAQQTIKRIAGSRRSRSVARWAARSSTQWAG